MSSQDRPLISTLIPLYKSRRFVHDIIRNIETIEYKPSEILISDRHCLDDTIDLLQKHFRADNRVRFFKHSDRADWVTNINFLLQTAGGKYCRIMPHDDIYPSCHLEQMRLIFQEDPEIIGIYGPVKAIDLEKNPIPSKTLTRPKPPLGYEMTLSNSVMVNFHSLFNGAFKALIDRDKIVKHQLWIKKTRQLINSERCWLFALSLVGRLHYYQDFDYHKRYYSGSESAKWRFSSFNQLNVAYLHISYLWQLGARFKLYQKVMASISLMVLSLRFILLVRCRKHGRLHQVLLSFPTKTYKSKWFRYMNRG